MRVYVNTSQTGVQPNGTAMDTDSGPDDPNTQGGAGVHTQGQGVLPSAAEMDAAVLDQLTPCFSETTNPIMTQVRFAVTRVLSV